MSVDEILRVRDLSVAVESEVDAPIVDSVDITIRRGECLGLVGESGSGKSLLMRSIIGLLPAPLVSSGEYLYSPEPGSELQSYDRRAVRGRDISMIFQEPMRSLNPARRVEWTLAEPLKHHLGLRGAALQDRILNSLADVGIPDAKRVARAFPHELSGGLQQRVMIAAALSTDPSLLLCDEPTTALDVTTQATIIELLKGLQESRGLSLLFVSHDLGVISEIADRVAVLYRGELMEVGSASDVIRNPGHSYTQMLVGSIPGQMAPTESHHGSLSEGKVE